MHKLNEAILVSDLEFQQGLIAKAYIVPLWNLDKNQIDEVSNSLLYSRGFASINALRVSNAKGDILFYKSDDEQLDYFDKSLQLPFTKIIDIPILKKGEFLGNVKISDFCFYLFSAFNHQFVGKYLFEQIKIYEELQRRSGKKGN
jgi:hypothetical protein